MTSLAHKASSITPLATSTFSRNKVISKATAMEESATTTAAATTTATTTSHQMENVKVAVRLRPFTEKERQKKNKRIVEIEKNTIALKNPKNSSEPSKKFTFDHSYWSHDGFKKDSRSVNVSDLDHANGSKYVSQEQVFDDLGKFLLDNTLKGYNSALLAYGQTGSGKSYTVSGYGANEGILPRFARALYVKLDEKVNRSEGGQENGQSLVERIDRYEVCFSMIEIYNEVVRDLLTSGNNNNNVNNNSGNNMARDDALQVQPNQTRRSLKVREHPLHGFFVENLTSYICQNEADIEHKIVEGQLNKSIAATRMNEMSSRGHTIYEFKIRQYKTDLANKSEEIVISSVVQLIDLAGSERMAVHLTNDDAVSSGTAHSGNSGSRASTPTQTSGDLSRSSSKRSNNKASSGNNNNNNNHEQADGLSVSSSTSTSVKQRSRSQTRGHPSGASGLQPEHQQRFKESVCINQSLSALGNCIQILSQYSQQLEVGLPGSSNATTTTKKLKIPYRDSVLTKLLLRCCLSGNSKVVIIAALSPADVNFDDTLSTLRFADRAKQIRTHATVNEILDDASDHEVDYDEQSARLGPKRAIAQPQLRHRQTYSKGKRLQVVPERDRERAESRSQSPSPSPKTPTRRRQQANKRSSGSSQRSKLSNGMSISNPALAGSMKDHETSGGGGGDNKPATKDTSGRLRKSRSSGQGLLASDNKRHRSYLDEDVDDDDNYDDQHNNQNNVVDDDHDDDYEARDENKFIMSLESDESLTLLTDDDLSNEEKIEIFNRMLNQSMGPGRTVSRRKEPAASRSSKGKSSSQAGGAGGSTKAKYARPGHSMKQISVISSNLKKSNPFLSNLNPDEQLTGVLSYIIKPGTTVIGKDADCDIIFQGAEIRTKHAKITRVDEPVNNRQVANVYIEPIPLDSGSSQTATVTTNFALKVNGSPIDERILLKHCDRLLFGTNTYYVISNNQSSESMASQGENPAAASTVANPDLVTYDMAKSEVLAKVMQDDKNKEMINQINGYVHRPGTGKHKSNGKRSQTSDLDGQQADQADTSKRLARGSISSNKARLTRSMTVRDNGDSSERQDDVSSTVEGPEMQVSQKISSNNNNEANDSSPDQTKSELESSDQDTMYRNQLLEDTYEYVIPVAEVNAVAEEMGLKVKYSLKILTGEEQLLEQPSSSSSTADSSELDSGKTSHSDETATTTTTTTGEDELGLETIRIGKLDGLDIPPALHIKVHSEEHGFDFYWPKEKFQARRFKILELYSAWNENGKTGLVEALIDQLRTQDSYLFDPFIDDPADTFVLVGNAQVALQPLAQLRDSQQTCEILDLDDEVVGTISVEIAPHKQSLDLSSSNSETVDLIDKRFAFVIKIISCSGLPKKYHNIFCQIKLDQEHLLRTKIQPSGDNDDLEASSREDSTGEVESNGNKADDETSETTTTSNKPDNYKKEAYCQLNFNMNQTVLFEKVTRDVSDFLDYGFLNIQIVGQYRVGAGSSSRSITIVSNIIDSINKYRYKMGQNLFGQNPPSYASSDFYQASDLPGRAESGSSGTMATASASNSGASSVASNSTTLTQYDQQNEYDESINGISQENIIDMILTKRKLDRAENQLHYLKRTVNIAEHYNKKHIPLRVVKKLLNSYGNEIDSNSIKENVASDDKSPTKEIAASKNKKSACIVQ